MARFSAPVHSGPGAHPASYNMGTVSVPGVMRPGCGVGHLPPPSSEVKERVELYLCSVSGRPLPLPYLLHLLQTCFQINLMTWEAKRGTRFSPSKQCPSYLTTMNQKQSRCSIRHSLVVLLTTSNATVYTRL